MKTKILAIGCLLSAGAFSIFAQGNLTPPGAPAPTMKSLDQIEARTPISSAPFTISASGSYYLTTNLTVSSGNAITIAANGVTLDLNGFTIASTAASAAGTAITMSAVTNVAIYNGNISSGVTNTATGVFSGSGFGYGIYYSGNAPFNVRVKAVSVAGILYHGIYLHTGNSTVVEGCTVNGAGNIGMEADSVANSTALNCGVCGIVASTAQNCTGSGLGDGSGLDAFIANNCYGYSSGNGYGLDAIYTATGCCGYSYGNGYGLYARIANNCYGTSSGSGNGLNASYVATGCYGSSVSSIGLKTFTADNCYGFSNTGDGLNASTANNCYGVSYRSGTGLYASYMATGCYGSSNTGYGLFTSIASVCHGDTSGGTALYTTHNVNSF